MCVHFVIYQILVADFNISPIQFHTGKKLTGKAFYVIKLLRFYYTLRLFLIK